MAILATLKDAAKHNVIDTENIDKKDHTNNSQNEAGKKYSGEIK